MTDSRLSKCLYRYTLKRSMCRLGLVVDFGAKMHFLQFSIRMCWSISNASVVQGRAKEQHAKSKYPDVFIDEILSFRTVDRRFAGWDITYCLCYKSSASVNFDFCTSFINSNSSQQNESWRQKVLKLAVKNVHKTIVGRKNTSCNLGDKGGFCHFTLCHLWHFVKKNTLDMSELVNQTRICISVNYVSSLWIL